MHTGTSISDGTLTAWIDWDAALSALHDGQIPVCGGEQRILQLAASVAEGLPVSLRATVPGLDNRNLELLITAIRHAGAGHASPRGDLATDPGARRTPAESDLARHLRISGHELRDAQLAEMAFQPSSLDALLSGQLGAAMLADLLGEEHPQLEHMLGMQAVAAHWGELPPREQKILLLYFYDDMTQAQIGQQLGISQMHVSRLLSRALGYLRPRVLGLDEHGDLADAMRCDHRR